MLSLVILCLFCSCVNDPVDQQTLVQDFYLQKTTALRQERLDICKEAVLAEARTSIDSLIDNWVSAALIDTINFPPKPSKPVKPEPIIDKFHKFELDSSVQKY